MQKKILINEICGLLESFDLHSLKIIKSFVIGIKK